ncbi:MAG: hypothetical protein L6Q99_00580 [Planctomycetes bacterium]|nr:hypothetical protein [Planctomycetota bacterium]
MAYALVARREYAFDDDAAHYLGLAESLLAGDGYAFEGRAHTRFPPGTSLAYLPTLALTGRNFVWIYATAVGWSLVALCFVHRWLRARGERHTLLLTLLVGTSATWLEHSTGASLSEAPFAACTYAALYASERSARGSRFAPLWLALAATGALLVRTIGLAWVGVALFGVFLGARVAARRAHRASATATNARIAARRESSDARAATQRLAPQGISQRALVVVAATLVFAALGWFAWTGGARGAVRAADFGHESSYVGQWLAADPRAPDLGSADAGTWFARGFEKLPVEARHAAEILTQIDWLPARIWVPWTLAAALLVGLGLRRDLARSNPIAGWLLVASALVLVSWPYDEGRRFLMPFVPLLLLFARDGLRVTLVAMRRAPQRVRRGFVGLLATSLVLLAVDVTTTTKPFATHELVAMGALASGGAVLLVWHEFVGYVQRVPKQRVLAASCLGWLACGAFAWPRVVERNHTRISNSRGAPLRAAADWLAEHASARDVILATPHAALYFATGLDVRPLPITADPRRLVAALDAERPTYVFCFDPRTNEYLRPVDTERRAVLERERPGEWREVHRGVGFAVLAPNPSTTRLPPGRALVPSRRFASDDPALDGTPTDATAGESSDAAAGESSDH